MIIKIDFKADDAVDHLWEAKMANFITDQPDRFLLLDGPERRIKNGTMYFCERYLEAKIFQAVLTNRKIESSIYLDDFDDCSDGFHPYVVITKEKFK